MAGPTIYTNSRIGRSLSRKWIIMRMRATPLSHPQSRQMIQYRQRGNESPFCHHCPLIIFTQVSRLGWPPGTILCSVLRSWCRHHFQCSANLSWCRLPKSGVDTTSGTNNPCSLQFWPRNWFTNDNGDLIENNHIDITNHCYSVVVMLSQGCTSKSALTAA